MFKASSCSQVSIERLEANSSKEFDDMLGAGLSGEALLGVAGRTVKVQTLDDDGDVVVGT